jgi:S1-C subfamily serine protease
MKNGKIIPAPKPPFPGMLASEPKPFLGIRMREIWGRVEIIEVIPNSAAEKAGLKSQDATIEFAGLQAASVQDIIELIESSRPGEDLKIRLKRNNENIEVNATMGKK